jgi:glycosyltransferase involved in cell wall biosynthesis
VVKSFDGGQSVSQVADICLITEGSYPFISGGVSTWAHQMVSELSEHTFHIVSIMPKDNGFEKKFAFPSNVIGHDVVYLQRLPESGKLSADKIDEIHERLRPLLYGLIDGVPFDTNSLAALVKVLASNKGAITQHSLLDSMAAWQTLLETYESGYSHLSFLDYFWTYRVMLSSLISVMIAPLPAAKVYHTVSTGFAGLMAARAKAETGSAVLLTEHGIYTNERRIEIVAAEWLQQAGEGALTVERMDVDLRDMWMRFFQKIGRVCYDSSDRVITLFADNQKAQVADGADVDRLLVIPNGIDIDHFASLPRLTNGVPTIGLIGRVVPIKDVKGFLQAVAILARSMPELRAYIIGPTEEDEAYALECRELANYLGIDQVVQFTGMASMDEYLPKLDLVVLTSISEAQPLVLLEAGACGIPLVAPEVGACAEIIRGTVEEKPAIGAGGVVTPLANPEATAQAVYSLLSDRRKYQEASIAIKKRVQQYYPKKRQYDAYRKLYSTHLG